MDQPLPRPPDPEAATMPAVSPPASPTVERVPALTDGPAAAAAPAAPPELADHPRYRVTALLGQGGMGAVYKAEHRRMERTVALKVVNPALVNHPSAVRRFHQEVRAAAKLQHANIVTAFDADQAGDLHFLVMEFVEGESLADYVARRGPLPFAEACDYARQAALGLQHAHEQGMVHRDVKPHNLMRTPQGRIKILDFGLARLAEAPDAPEPEAPPGPACAEMSGEAARLTVAGAVMGTADYISPEQANDSHRIDIRADIYSLGCTLYHLLTGAAPFPGGSALDKVVRHAAEQPAAPGKLRRGLPPGLAAVILKMMAKDPARRYQTPAEAAKALAPFAARPRPRWRLAAAAAAAVVLAALLTALTLSPPHRRHDAPPVPPAPDSNELAGRASFADDLPAVSAEALALAGEGDPSRAPPELAAVLGDPRFRLTSQTGFPAFSPAGDRLAVPSGPDVLVFDAAGRLLHTLRGHADRVYRVAYSPDGGRIASASRDRSVKLWDAASGRELPSPAAGPVCGAFPSLDFGPGGKTLAAADADGRIRLFDLSKGTEIPALDGAPADVCCVAFRPDGKALAAAARNGAVCVWDVPGRALKATLSLRQEKPGDENGAVAYSPDGSLLAAGSESEERTWDGDSLAERGRADAPGAGLTAFAADGRSWRLVTAGRDCRPDRECVVRCWRVADGMEEEKDRRLRLGKGGVALYALRPDGKALAAFAYSQLVVRLYDADGGAPLFPETGHAGAVHALAYSPDGATLASGGDEGAIKLWDLRSGGEARTLAGHAKAVRALAFSPDGATLASGGDDGRVLLWDIADGRTRRTLPGHADGVEDLAFSPDGKTLASCGKDHAVRLWGAAGGEPLGEPMRSEGGVSGLAFAPGARSLAVVGDSPSAMLWDLETRKQGPSHSGEEALRRAAFLPGAATLATAGGRGLVRLWDAKTLAPGRDFPGSAAELTGLAVRADGKLIAAAGGDGAVRLWDAGDPARGRVFFLGPAGSAADAVAFSPEGRYLAAAAPDGTIRLHRLARRGEVFAPDAGSTLFEERRLAGHDKPEVHSVAFEPDGRHVLTSCPDNRVRRWDADSGASERLAQTLPLNAGPAVILPDGARLLSVRRDRKLQLVDLRPGGKETVFKEALKGETRAVALSADGRLALTGGDDGAARLWDVEKGAALGTFQAPDRAAVRAVAVASADGRVRRVLVACADRVSVWDGAGDKPSLTAADYHGPAGLCVSADGARAAWGGDDGLVYVWDFDAGRELHRLPYRDGAVRAVAFSPDGKRLLAGGDKGLLSLWEVETGRVLDRTRTAPALAVAFSPDGRRAVVGCDDAAAHVWRLP